NVEVNAEGDSNVIAVTATADSERAAMAAANAYTRAVLAVRKKELLRQVDVKLASYQRSLDRLGTGDAATATAASLNDSIAQLEQIKDGDDPNFSLLQAASKAETTGTPKNIVLVLGLLGGLVIGVGSALVLEQLDRRIRDEDGLTEAYPLPILTRVPYVLDTEGSPQLREAFRTLQVQLDLGAEKRQVVMFTSASAGDGKTMSAIELAKTLVASGFRVALLDFDLRKPDIGTRLGVNSDVLTLFGSSPHLNDALVEAPGHAGLFVFSTESRNGVAPMLEALFGRLPEMLAQAREIADVVIIDTAPLGRVSDALRVAAVADEILLVGRPGNTDRKDLLVARELMGHMNITPTGMVVVGGGSSSYGYYGDAVEPQPQSVAPAPERLNGDDRARRRARRNSVK
ncbi:MAG TPA: CpsD/CapB family tyrosine-protein kinase, partial [Baekduia sp.]|nr:CpsD/CapB family tyrosine-protein kinase [Baekduia sp.]